MNLWVPPSPIIPSSGSCDQSPLSCSFLFISFSSLLPRFSWCKRWEREREISGGRWHLVGWFMTMHYVKKQKSPWSNNRDPRQTPIFSQRSASPMIHRDIFFVRFPLTRDKDTPIGLCWSAPWKKKEEKKKDMATWGSLNIISDYASCQNKLFFFGALALFSLSPDTDALVRDLVKPQDPSQYPWRPKSGASGRLVHTLADQ